MTKENFLKQIEAIVDGLAKNYGEKILEEVLDDFDLFAIEEDLGNQCLDLELEEMGDCEDDEDCEDDGE